MLAAAAFTCFLLLSHLRLPFLYPMCAGAGEERCVPKRTHHLDARFHVSVCACVYII